MSLRPHFSAFRVDVLREVIGSQSAEREASLIRHYDALVQPHDEDERGEAHALIGRLISGELESSPPVEESETLAYVMIALASFGQDPEASSTLFWEAFLGRVDEASRAGALATGTERQLARYLLRGRPYFGEEIASNWAYYAILFAPQLKDLLELIQSERFSTTYERDQGLAWLTDVERRGLDVFFYAY